MGKYYFFHNVIPHYIFYSTRRVGRWALGVGRWALGVGRWALGVGRWALGVGRWALGVGRWALGKLAHFKRRGKYRNVKNS